MLFSSTNYLYLYNFYKNEFLYFSMFIYLFLIPDFKCQVIKNLYLLNQVFVYFVFVCMNPFVFIFEQSPHGPSFSKHNEMQFTGKIYVVVWREQD